LDERKEEFISGTREDIIDEEMVRIDKESVKIDRQLNEMQSKNEYWIRHGEYTAALMLMFHITSNRIIRNSKVDLKDTPFTTLN